MPMQWSRIPTTRDRYAYVLLLILFKLLFLWHLSVVCAKFEVFTEAHTHSH